MSVLDHAPDELAAAQAPTSRFSERERAVIETGLIVSGFFAAFFLLPHHLHGDDIVRFHDLRVLLNRHSLTNSRFSLVMPMASLPVVLLGDLVKTRIWWATHFSVIVFAIGVVVAYRLLRGKLDPRLFRHTVLILLFASYFTNRLGGYDVEAFSTTLLTLGIICLATRQHVFLGWAVIVIAVIDSPAEIVGLALLAGYQALRTRQLRHLAAVPVAALGIMAEDAIRRGGLFTTGYGHQSFTYPFALGLVSILFSFGRGLLFFMPGLALWLDPRRRAALPGRPMVTMTLVFTAGLILVYSSWWAWYGGMTWGPRFFTLAAVPASIMLAIGIKHAGRSAAADAVTLGVLALSAWVTFAAVVVQYRALHNFCHKYWDEQYCLYTPSHSALYQSVVPFPHLTAQVAVLAAFGVGIAAYLAAPLVRSVIQAVPLSRLRPAGWRI